MRIKNLTPVILAIIGVFICTFFGILSKLPYDENNIVQGTSFNKKLNPYNNVLRVLFFYFITNICFFFYFYFSKKSK